MIRRHVNYANVAATLALLLAISGFAYAASLPRNSVGTRQLKKGAVTTKKLDRGAVTTKKVKNSNLRLRDLGGKFNKGRRAVSQDIVVPGNECREGFVEGKVPAPKGFIGSLVVGYLTDDQGGAVLDNNGLVVPTIISETSQTGALGKLLVCDTDGNGLTVPAGSVFHYRLIAP